MLKFVSIELDNFAVFREARIKFALDHGRPLTVIRGENQSGKSTLMRAFFFALYGERGLGQLGGEVHPIRSACATPGAESRAGVSILFEWTETDGSKTRYNLRRSAVTRPKQDASGYETFDELLTLAQVNDSGRAIREVASSRIQELFPWSLRDFYFIDADRAEDFVGGKGNPDASAMKSAVTSAINALLSLQELASCERRFRNKATELQAEAARSSASEDRRRLGAELRELDSNYKESECKLAALNNDLKDAKLHCQRAEAALESSVGDKDKSSKAKTALLSAKKDLERASSESSSLTARLAEAMNSPVFFKEIAWPIFDQITECLDRLKDAGFIPVQELTVCKRLLQQQRCLCGAALDHTNIEGVQAVEGQLRKIDEQSVNGARILDQALELARMEGVRCRDAVHTQSITDLMGQVLEATSRLTDSSAAYKIAEEEAQKHGGTGLSSALDLKRSADEHVSKIQEAVERQEASLAELGRQLDSVKRRLKLAEKKENKAGSLDRMAEVCDDIAQAIGKAYAKLESAQLERVSVAMNRIYSQVTNSSPFALDGVVGVRVADDPSCRQYELFAKSMHGQEKALGLLNGAARRTLGVAFVLALAEVAGEDIPLVADSLLHTTSAETHQRLLGYLTDGERVRQPVLFGTGQDFYADSTRQIIAGRAGASYTLTSQSQVGDKVARRDPDAQSPFETRVCECNPSEYCVICERTEWDLRTMALRS